MRSCGDRCLWYIKFTNVVKLIKYHEEKLKRSMVETNVSDVPL
jgi:hypothetical protein